MQNGEKLGRYIIRQKIGEGGMGEVFLAYDEQLDRNVVLKILLPKFLEDIDLVRRFKLEAKAVSALNHPNIITIHEIVETPDITFIVYEFIKGKTLREKILRNQLTINESIKIIEQVARGLQAAHKAGIIHRDIKPENIMIRDDGYVRILDFGLAKKSVFKTDSESKTAQLVKTAEGMIMGSIQYMSPEQARGEKMDERTDIWSLGVVFYEMLTGVSPFSGKTLSDSLALVLQSKPQPPSEINQNIPKNLQKVIGRSLEKNRDERYPNIENFLLDLHGLNIPKKEKLTENGTLQYAPVTNANETDISKENTIIQETRPVNNVATNEQPNSEVKTVSKRKYWHWAAFAVIPIFLLLTGVLALAGFGGWYYYSSLRANVNVPFREFSAEPLTKDKNADLVSISSDGKIIAFVKNFSGNQTLTLRQLADGKEIDLVQPEVGSFYAVNFTNDGDSIFYLLENSGDRTLYRISALGGESKKIGENVHSNVKFSPDGKLFAYLRLNAGEDSVRVFVADTDGSNLREVVSSKEISYDTILDLDWSPDGKKLFLAVLGKSKQDTGSIISLGTVDLNIEKEPISTKAFQVLNNDGWRAVQSSKWLTDSSGILFIGGKTIDETKQIYHLAYPGGEVTRITNDTSNYSTLDFSADEKTMIASKANILAGMWEINAETGTARQISAETETILNFTDISVSQDGRIYYSKIDGKFVNIYSMNPEGQEIKQITSNSWNMGAYITPDNKYLISTGKTVDGYYGIVRMNPDGTNPVFLTRIKDKMDMMPRMSSDGTVVFMRLGLDWRFPKLMKVNINGGEVSNIFNDNQKLEMYPTISPDGKHLAFINFFSDSASNKVQMKMKVIEFSDSNAGKTVLEKEIEQFTRMLWSEDSKNLLYIEPKKKMNLIKISLADKKEEPLTDFKTNIMEGAFTFSLDGKKIFAVRSSDSRELVLIKDASKQSQ